MATIPVTKGAYHRHLVSQFAEHWKMTSKSDPGKGSFHLTIHSTVFRRSRHLGVKGLHVGGTALQVQHDNTLVSQEIVNITLSGLGLERQKISQAKTA